MRLSYIALHSPIRCSVTTRGLSSNVTVHIPSAPCSSTSGTSSSGKRTGYAAVVIATDFVAEKLAKPEEAMQAANDQAARLR